LRKTTKQLFRAANELGKAMGLDSAKSSRALKKALVEQKSFETKQAKGIMNEKNEETLSTFIKSGQKMLRIAVIGHVYNLYDSYANMNLFDRLARHGIYAITLEMLDNNTIDECAESLPKRMFWYFGRKAVGGSLHLTNIDDIDGIIYIMSFGCGVDSFTCDLASRLVRRRKEIPFTILTIDEHSGEAGIETRIEAFADLIRRKKAADDNHLSTPGECIYNS
jgi:predicted nucleotide-binding protein (sugar kinase/HSP70/actin superfamily)